ncbi:MAG TPA: Na/Pi symporter, partial [Roseivirga sp.]
MTGTTVEFNQKTVALRALLILSALLFFLFSIKLLVASLGNFTDILQNSILSTTLDPFVGLFIGLLTTAIIQSSSTTSTMTVAMVATGTLTIQESVPIILGANVGTTLTSTIVALGYISDRFAFRKAISAGVIHDFYNIILVIILFPLELYYGVLSKTSIYLQEFLIGNGSMNSNFRLDKIFDFGLTRFFVELIGNQFAMMFIALIGLFASIKLLTSVIQKSIIGDSRNKLRSFVFEKPFKSFGWGMAITAAIQSSSVTTSLVVPLVATQKLKLRNVFPFIIGANLGTTITALIAASFSSKIALSIALTHLLVNLIGAILFMSFGKLRAYLVSFTKRFSIVFTTRRVLGLAYILFTFFLIPFLLITLHKSLSQPKP